MKPFRRTVIGKHALVLAAKGNTELASQVFVYDQIREIRVDLKKLEVKVLMTYDESFYRVFIVKAENETEDARKNAESIVIKFYNDLLNATMKLTPEELQNIKKQHDEQIKKIKELQAKEKSNSTKNKK